MKNRQAVKIPFEGIHVPTPMYWQTERVCLNPDNHTAFNQGFNLQFNNPEYGYLVASLIHVTSSIVINPQHGNQTVRVSICLQ